MVRSGVYKCRAASLQTVKNFLLVGISSQGLKTNETNLKLLDIFPKMLINIKDKLSYA